MPLDSRPTTKSHQVGGAGAPLPEPEQLSCPRCDSLYTKFCYYNNYNFSQPRHFCKSCRRYWTHGGTLRDVPIGGATRKNAKRSRTNAPSPSSDHHIPVHAACTQAFAPFSEAAAQGGNGLNVCGSFTSLLSTQAAPGFLALGGFGLGLGPSFEDMGIGLGRAAWPFPGIFGDGGGTSIMGNAWQVESGGEGWFSGGGDCYCLPGLAISTPRNGLK
ncbi:hypothetical protein Vadar_004500 [Vaccinium darrowii]|uniref:Uncharacterized protein n=1 Tax=Vaccinium darrowii TaxID=229202 RepID=A0ACB7XWU6_9ERIC|nr:hypothetical protein Vadar_004500 [Vaccinium darrowii]